MGIATLLIIDYSSLPGRPAASDPVTAWAAYSAAFANRSAAVIAGMILDGGAPTAVEIWNEPDLSTVGNVPAAVFGQLLKAAYTAIKRVAPDTTVVMGGLATGNPGYLSEVKSAAGGSIPADAIGIHPYGQRPSPSWPTPTWGFGVLTDLLQRYSTVDPTKTLQVATSFFCLCTMCVDRSTPPSTTVAGGSPR